MVFFETLDHIFARVLVSGVLPKMKTEFSPLCTCSVYWALSWVKNLIQLLQSTSEIAILEDVYFV